MGDSHPPVLWEEVETLACGLSPLPIASFLCKTKVLNLEVVVLCSYGLIPAVPVMDIYRKLNPSPLLKKSQSHDF